MNFAFEFNFGGKNVKVEGVLETHGLYEKAKCFVCGDFIEEKADGIMPYTDIKVSSIIDTEGIFDIPLGSKRGKEILKHIKKLEALVMCDDCWYDEDDFGEYYAEDFLSSDEE